MAASSDRKELKANWKNEVEVKTVKKTEVEKHKSKTDLWIVIHGKVYDVTEYAKDHPGGVDALVEVAGTDATSAYEDVGHSEDAREIMHTFLVGVLEGAKPEEMESSGSAPLPDTQIVRRSPPEPTKKTGNTRKHQIELAALAVGTVALTYFAFTSHAASSIAWIKPATHHASFTQGFITACVALSVGSGLGFHYLAKAGNVEKTFSSYPPHIQSKTPAPPTFHPAGVLSPTDYRRYRLRRKEELADGIWRFVFDLPTKYSVLGLPIGQHVAIKGTIEEHTVVRSYTPISNNRDLGRLELLIRVYPQGQLGNYLKALNPGDEAEIRGPKGAMRYRRGMAKHVGMIGGGTGITPLFQLVRAICEDPKDDTQVTLIYGNRSESDIMLKDRLDNYAKVAGHKFKLHYTLDQPSDSWAGGRGHVTKDLLSQHMPTASDDTKMLLCGPPGMVNAVKTSLVELGFKEPGAVSKMSDQIFCF